MTNPFGTFVGSGSGYFQATDSHSGLGTTPTVSDASFEY